MQVRQGDLLIEMVEALPGTLHEVAPELRGGAAVLVVARGELSGHAHVVPVETATFLVPAPGARSDLVLGWLRVRQPTALGHDEHSAVELAPGMYRVTQQRRYDPAREDRWRRATD